MIQNVGDGILIVAEKQKRWLIRFFFFNCLVLWKIEKYYWLHIPTLTVWHRPSPSHCPLAVTSLLWRGLLPETTQSSFFLTLNSSLTDLSLPLCWSSFCRWPHLSHQPLLSQNLTYFQNHIGTCVNCWLGAAEELLLSQNAHKIMLVGNWEAWGRISFRFIAFWRASACVLWWWWIGSEDLETIKFLNNSCREFYEGRNYHSHLHQNQYIYSACSISDPL